MLFVQKRDYLCYGESSPRIKQILRQTAIAFCENGSPCKVVQRHRICDCPIAVEQVGVERPRSHFELHSTRSPRGIVGENASQPSVKVRVKVNDAEPGIA